MRKFKHYIIIMVTSSDIRKFSIRNFCVDELYENLHQQKFAAIRYIMCLKGDGCLKMRGA